MLSSVEDKREKKNDTKNGVLVTSNSQLVGMFFVEES
jgi:hypothetical protein